MNIAVYQDFLAIDDHNVIKLEVHVLSCDKDSGSPWAWFSQETFSEFVAELRPIIKDSVKNEHEVFHSGFNSIKFIKGPTIRIAYFLKQDSPSLYPCLIKDIKGKFNVVKTSSIKLICSTCSLSCPQPASSQHSTLTNVLKRYLGPVTYQATTIPSYFQTEESRTQRKVENELCDEASNNSNTNVKGYISNEEDPLAIDQCEDDNRAFKQDQAVNSSLSDDMFSYAFEVDSDIKDCCTSTQSSSETHKLQNTKFSRSDNDYESNDTDDFQTQGGKVTNTYRCIQTLNDSMNEASSSENNSIDLDRQHSSEYFRMSENQSPTEEKLKMELRSTFKSSPNKIVFESPDNGVDELKNTILQSDVLIELEKPDETIDRLVAEARSYKAGPKKLPRYRRTKVMNVLQPKNLKSILKGPSVARKKTESKAKPKLNALKKKKQQISMLTDYFDSTKSDEKVCAGCDSGSDDDLPPAFDFGEEYQPSREEVWESFSQFKLEKRVASPNKEDIETRVASPKKEDIEKRVASPKTEDISKDEFASQADWIQINPAMEVTSPEQNADIDTKESWVIVEEIKAERDVLNLKEEHLEYILEENDEHFKNIFRGKNVSWRHDDYASGGLKRSRLINGVFISLFSDKQVDFVMEWLLNIFCKKDNKYSDYVFKVLLTEALIKIVMHCKNVSYDAAELLLYRGREGPT